MPYAPSSIAAITANTAPIAGVSRTPVELLSGEQRETMGLGPLPSAQSQALASKSTLGKNDFLKLLLAQLSNQDPLKPLEDKEFIAQLAQFNSLEQMQQMNTHLVDLLAGMSLAEGSNLLGKFVEAGSVSGVVNAVNMVDGRAQITLATDDGDVQVALTQVTRVLQSEDDLPVEEPLAPEVPDETEETAPIP